MIKILPAEIIVDSSLIETITLPGDRNAKVGGIDREIKAVWRFLQDTEGNDVKVNVYGLLSCDDSDLFKMLDEAHKEAEKDAY